MNGNIGSSSSGVAKRRPEDPEAAARFLGSRIALRAPENANALCPAVVRGYEAVMRQRITVPLPKELLDQARRKAAAEGRSLNSLIEEGLRLMLGEEPTSRTARPLQTSQQ